MNRRKSKRKQQRKLSKRLLLDPQTDSSLIPKTVAEVEDVKLSLSFSKYNDNICEIKLLDQARGRAVIAELRKMGDSTEAEFASKNIKVARVDNHGAYKRYYHGLEQETTVLESKPSGTARIFFYIEAKKLFIIAITNNHTNTSKNYK
jgi:hypothetical protein